MTSGKTKEFLKSPGRPGPKILDPEKSLGSFFFRVPKSEDHFTVASSKERLENKPHDLTTFELLYETIL